MAFTLNFKQYLSESDESTSVTGTVFCIDVDPFDPYVAKSNPSRAKKLHYKYLSGPSKGNMRRGNCFGCGSNIHLASNCAKKDKPEVTAKIKGAVAELYLNNMSCTKLLELH